MSSRGENFLAVMCSPPLRGAGGCSQCQWIDDLGPMTLTTQRTRKVCPDGADSCGDPFKRSEVCVDSSERQRVEQLTSAGSLNLVSQ